MKASPDVWTTWALSTLGMGGPVEAVVVGLVPAPPCNVVDVLLVDDEPTPSWIVVEVEVDGVLLVVDVGVVVVVDVVVVVEVVVVVDVVVVAGALTRALR